MLNPLSSLEAFKQYFLSVKPYHTKILNAIQRYAFFDAVNTNILDAPQFSIDVENAPLCNQTGFGVNFDACCGFSATECCDLFSCVGGYGIIFDNSDLTNSQTILSANANSGTFTIAGNQTYDTRIQILSYVSSTSISVAGDQTAYLNKSQLFYIIPYNVYSIQAYTTNSITLNGNYAAQISQRKEIIIYGSGTNDGTFYVISSIYDASSNTTTVVLDTSTKQLYPNITNMMAQFKQTVATYNDGLYQSVSAFFNGVNTVVTLNPNVKIINFLNTSPGSILLHTGFLQNRIVTLENFGTNDSDYTIQFSSYNTVTNQTTVQLNTYLNNSYGSSGNMMLENPKGYFDSGVPTPTPTPSPTPIPAIPTANLYGYLTGPGFDGTPECNIPKDFNISAALSEKLNIQIIYAPSPTPNPTPSPTPTPVVDGVAPVTSYVISFSPTNNLTTAGMLQVNALTDTQNNVVGTLIGPNGATNLEDRILVFGDYRRTNPLPPGYYGVFNQYYGSLIFLSLNNGQGVVAYDPALKLSYAYSFNATPPYQNASSMTLDIANNLLWVAGDDNNLYCYLIENSFDFISFNSQSFYDRSGQISALLGNGGSSYGDGSSFGLLTFPTSDVCIVSYNKISIFKPQDINFYNLQLELYAQVANGCSSSNTIFGNKGIEISQYSTLDPPFLFALESKTSGVDSYLYSYDPDSATIQEISSYPYGNYFAFANNYLFVAQPTLLSVFVWNGTSLSAVAAISLTKTPLTIKVAWINNNFYRISTFAPESFDFDGTSLTAITVNETEWDSPISAGWAGTLTEGFSGPPSPTVSITPTQTITPSINTSPTPSLSFSQTPYSTPTITPTLSITASVSPTPSLTPTLSHTPSITPSNNSSPTPTPTPTIFRSISPTPTLTITPSVSG
jgi:hypothetical protein